MFCLAGGAITYMYVNGLPGWLSGLSEQRSEAPEGGGEPAPPPAAEGAGDESAARRPRLDVRG